MKDKLFAVGCIGLFGGGSTLAKTRSDFNLPQHSSDDENRTATQPRHPTSKKRRAARLA
jgi:hypothetical protein